MARAYQHDCCFAVAVKDRYLLSRWVIVLEVWIAIRSFWKRWLQRLTGASTAWTDRGSKSSRSAKGGVRGHDGADCRWDSTQGYQSNPASAGRAASSTTLKTARDLDRFSIDDADEGRDIDG